MTPEYFYICNSVKRQENFQDHPAFWGWSFVVKSLKCGGFLEAQELKEAACEENREKMSLITHLLFPSSFTNTLIRYLVGTETYGKLWGLFKKKM